MSTRRSIADSAGTITYDLIFTRRKTLGIIVHPDRRVTVRAPKGVSLDEVDRIVKKRAEWILRKQGEFERYPPTQPPPQYNNGEYHRFLGAEYPLEIVVGRPQSVQLTHGRFLITARDIEDPDRIKGLLTEWYRDQARQLFAERLAACYPKIQGYNIPSPELKIRLMKRRWGSCYTGGRINLNLRLIQAPIRHIDYVIIHELCHLKEHNHGRGFYALLDQLLPDWRQRREELNRLEII